MNFRPLVIGMAETRGENLLATPRFLCLHQACSAPPPSTPARPRVADGGTPPRFIPPSKSDATSATRPLSRFNTPAGDGVPSPAPQLHPKRGRVTPVAITFAFGFFLRAPPSHCLPLHRPRELRCTCSARTGLLLRTGTPPRNRRRPVDGSWHPPRPGSACTRALRPQREA